MKPKAVQDQEDRANQILKDLNNPPKPGEGDPDPNPNPEPNPNPDPNPEPQDPPAPPAEDYKAKYDTLQGKYNAEVPGLYGQIGDLQIKLAEAMASISKLEANKNKPPDTPTPEPPGLSYMRKEMPEMEEAIRYIIKSEVEKVVKESVGAKIDETGTRLNTLETKTVENIANVFYSELKKAVPNWTVINEEAGFLSWLETIEPYTGYKKMDLLQDAYNKFDSARVIKFFTDYVKEKDAHKKGTPNPALNKFEAPPKPGGSGDLNPNPVDETISAAEITRFYNDVALGKYRNREKERQDTEAKINKAIAAGKVV